MCFCLCVCVCKVIETVRLVKLLKWSVCALCAASIDHHFSICLLVLLYFFFNPHSSSLPNFSSSLLNLHLYIQFDYVSFEITIIETRGTEREKKRKVTTTTATSGKT